MSADEVTDPRRVRPEQFIRPATSDICACMGGTKIPCPDYPTRTLDDWALTGSPRAEQETSK